MSTENKELQSEVKMELVEDQQSLSDQYGDRLCKLEDLMMKLRLNRIEEDFDNYQKSLSCSKRNYLCPPGKVTCLADEDESSESETDEDNDSEVINSKLDEAIKKLEDEKKRDEENLEKRKEETKQNNIKKQNRNFKVSATKTEAIKANVKNRPGKKPSKAPVKVKSAKN